MWHGSHKQIRLSVGFISVKLEAGLKLRRTCWVLIHCHCTRIDCKRACTNVLVEIAINVFLGTIDD